MSTERDFLSRVWALAEEKNRLCQAAGALLLSQPGRDLSLVRAAIALACALGFLLVPLVSAGEEITFRLAGLA